MGVFRASSCFPPSSSSFPFCVLRVLHLSILLPYRDVNVSSDALRWGVSCMIVPQHDDEKCQYMCS